MKRITYTVGAASFVAQMRKAAELQTKMHDLAIEYGAEWDGQDGYSFTDEQHARYVVRLELLGLRTDRHLGGISTWAEIVLQEEKRNDG